MFVALTISVFIVRNQLMNKDGGADFETLILDDNPREDLLPTNGDLQIVHHGYFSQK